MAELLGKTAVRLTLRLGGSLDYLMKMPVKSFMNIVEEVIKADEESRKKQ